MYRKIGGSTDSLTLDCSLHRRVVSLDKKLSSALSLFKQAYIWLPATNYGTIQRE